MKSTNVVILDRTYSVYGYPGEGWFENLSNRHKAEGLIRAGAISNLGIKPNSVCLDVGANLGLVTLVLARLVPQGQVYAFEPDPLTFAAFKKTLEAAKATNVIAHDWVVGCDNVTGRFVIDDKFRSSCHFIPDTVGVVKSHSIDSMNLPKVDFIKIDAEGSELDILDGALHVLERDRPTVLVEFNSFAFTYYRDLLPRFALKKICSMFSRVRYFDRKNVLTDLTDQESFLRQNLLEGCVDDLVCT